MKNKRLFAFRTGHSSFDLKKLHEDIFGFRKVTPDLFPPGWVALQAVVDLETANISQGESSFLALRANMSTSILNQKSMGFRIYFQKKLKRHQTA